MKKNLTSIILAFTFILILAACGNNNADGNGGNSDNADRIKDLQDKGKVVVGFADEKPYAYEEDGELKGVAVDVATEIFKELGIDEVEGHLQDFDQLIPGLNAEKFDVVTASMAINGDRCENVAFGEPEVQYGEGLIVQKGNPLDLHSYEDIADNPDATVSIMSGATEHGFVQEEGVDPSQVQDAPDIAATLAAVESGRADATTGTEMTIKMAFESADSDNLEWVEDFEQPNIEGVPSYGAAAFRQDDDQLREAYNEKLAELKETDKYGELLEANYFSLDANGVMDDITTEMVCSGEVYQ
ncbi:MAG TPA: ectoine/hydroxyectoine ABC transporter substrate-binding protein EhuB [Pseudogracilibacillus sp.]|nr:ectoine/hydroxyectoine ABC transporter substrate-binding protein EhuB [Pseudogracilibacillus sp.]